MPHEIDAGKIDGATFQLGRLAAKMKDVNINGRFCLAMESLWDRSQPRTHWYDHERTVLDRRAADFLGIAVSGGVDSLCLAFLLHRHLQQQPESLHKEDVHTLVFDHQLRQCSKEEAKEVSEVIRSKFGMLILLFVCTNLSGFQAHILTLEIDGNTPTRIEALARTARLAALASACADFNISELLTAHHLDDQIETFYLRLIMGSGGQGLAAMRPEQLLPVSQAPLPLASVVKLIRPLLGYPKVLDYVPSFWVTDPV